MSSAELFRAPESDESSDSCALDAQAEAQADCQAEQAFAHAARDNETPVSTPDKPVVLFEGGTQTNAFGLAEYQPDVQSKGTGKAQLLWIGLVNPSAQEVAAACKILDQKPFVLERLQRSYHRPKSMAYSQCFHMVLMPVYLKNKYEVHYDELQVLFGQDFLLTIIKTQKNRRDFVKEQFRQEPEMIARGADYLVANMLDTLTDKYASLSEKLEKMGTDFEKKFLFGDEQDDESIRQLFKLRQLVLKINDVVHPVGEISQKLLAIKSDIVESDSRQYYQVIAERVHRLEDHLMGIRTSLDFVFEASIMIMQTKQNDIIKKLGSWAAIAIVPTIIAAIYGMNFTFMPELKWRWGYPVCLMLMLGLSYALYRKFKKSGWL